MCYNLFLHSKRKLSCCLATRPFVVPSSLSKPESENFSWGSLVCGEGKSVHRDRNYPHLTSSERMFCRRGFSSLPFSLTESFWGTSSKIMLNSTFLNGVAQHTLLYRKFQRCPAATTWEGPSVSWVVWAPRGPHAPEPGAWPTPTRTPGLGQVLPCSLGFMLG